MKNQFDKLMKDFCRLCAIADVDAIAGGAALDVDGVHFSIVYNEKTAADRLFVFCDYGAVPPERQSAVYAALLEANLFIYDTDTAVFSLSAETGHVICAMRFMLDGLQAETLRDVLSCMSKKAAAWRTHYFGADDLSAKMPAPGARGSARKMAAQLNASKP